MTAKADVGNGLAAGALSALDAGVLQHWMVEQRWFASKARQVARLHVLEQIPLRTESPLLILALVEARFHPGTHELYQLPIGVRPASEGYCQRVIAQVGDWTLYDALADPVHARELLARLREGSVAAGDGTVEFHWAAGAGNPSGRDHQHARAVGVEHPEVRPVGVEQSNSSVVFDDALILKTFRRLEPGVNPELELLRFLSERGFEHIAPLAGWYEYEGRLMDATLGVLQAFIRDAQDGWELALDELGRAPEGFLDRLEALGRVTGELHTALGSDAADPSFAPDEPSTESLALLTATVDEQIERIFVELPEDERLEPIAGRGQDVRERLLLLSHVGVGGRVIRTHGDYHLGQTMYRPDGGWIILDFEGEPARTLPERRLKRSPLRDVAGMLRSFAYAASASAILRGIPAPPGWEDRARSAFLDAYFASVDPSLLPPGQDAMHKLLSIFELEKAVYELRYELNHRPDWIGIPVAGIARLLEAS